MTVATESATIRIHVDTNGWRWLVATAWPGTIHVPIEVIARNPECVRIRWPYMTLRFANGRAMYQVETCEQGVWRGRLMEGYLCHPS